MLCKDSKFASSLVRVFSNESLSQKEELTKKNYLKKNSIKRKSTKQNLQLKMDATETAIAMTEHTKKTVTATAFMTVSLNIHILQ